MLFSVEMLGRGRLKLPIYGCKLLKNGCLRHSVALGLMLGSILNMKSSKSLKVVCSAPNLSRTTSFMSFIF